MAGCDRPSRLRAFARGVAACVTVALVVLTAGCSATTPPSPSPSPPDAPMPEVMREEVAAVFEAVYGDDAVRAVLIQQHGEPVYEQYWDSTPEETWDVRGVTRTIVSTLVGIAIDRGLISGVDATLGTLLPDYAALMTPEVAAIDLKAVLTSTASFAATSDEADLRGGPSLAGGADWIATILQDRIDRGPGDGAFLSSEVGAHVLAAIVAEATGMSPLRFAQEALFDPLGIDAEPLWEERFTTADPADLLHAFDAAGIAWLADPQGVNLGYTHLRLHPTDLLRIGQLFLDEGDWDGVQVVSPRWAVEATFPLVAPRGYGSLSYGYQWWVDRAAGVFFAQGQGGTALVIDTRLDAVAVVASEVSADDERATHGFAASTAVGLAIALLRDLPGNAP